MPWRYLPTVSYTHLDVYKRQDTSLVYILAMNDLMRVTRAFVQRDFDTTPFLSLIHILHHEVRIKTEHVETLFDEVKRCSRLYAGGERS